LATPIPKLYLIKTKSELAAELGVPLSLLESRAFTARQSLLYHRSEQPKRDGSLREIFAPNWPLANIQRGIATLLGEIYRPSPRASGFVAQRGIKRNAEFHVGKKLILNFDLEDFFPSINMGRILFRLRAPPYHLSPVVSLMIAKLCTLNNSLPIGAPSSPVLSNIIASHLDGVLTTTARSHGSFYSRYADDITFSTNRGSFTHGIVHRDEGSATGWSAGADLVAAVSTAGFSINPRKTRVLGKSDQQSVCGVTVNEQLSVDRRLLRSIRGAIHAWATYGKADAEKVFHEKFNWRGSQDFETHLRGRLEYVKYISGPKRQSTFNLIDKYNHLPERALPDIHYEKVPSPYEQMQLGTCLIECESNEEMQWFQGSGIRLKDGRVLTNYHVTHHTGGAHGIIHVRLPENLGFPVEMQISKLNKHFDACILEPTDLIWSNMISLHASDISFEKVRVQDQISISGFPAYVEGNEPEVSYGHVTGFQKLDGVPFAKTTNPVYKGNSGGPMFNARHQIVGLATRGIDAEEPNVTGSNGTLELFRIEKFLL